MKRPLIILLLLIPLMNLDGISPDIKTAFKNLSPEHPRLFLNAAQEAEWKSGIESNPFSQPLAAHVIKTADQIIPLPPSERILEGRRLLEVSRLTLKRILYLGVAYRLTGEKKYADRAISEMKAMCEFSDWNPSHYLDVAEMTTALAIGYDWLYHEISSEDREQIAKAIIVKGLQPSFPQSGEPMWWVSADNNWNQVCHAGLTLGALAIYERAPELAEKIIDRAVKNLPRIMETYAPDGAYVEGPSYWAYGTNYNVIFLAAVENALGTDFGLTHSPGFLASADYMQHILGPTGTYFNYADSEENARLQPALFWMADRRKQPSLLWQQTALLNNFTNSEMDEKKHDNRFAPLLLIWGGDQTKLEKPTLTHWQATGKMPVAFHRSSWEKNASYVAIKGGSPSLNHAHMDVGSFVLEMNGIRWAIDLGMENYYNVEKQGIQLWGKSQNAERWGIFRIGSFSHNIITVNGEQQRVRGNAPILSSNPAPEHKTVIDLASVYKGQLASAKRSVQLGPKNKIILKDNLKALDKKTQIRWAMMTNADIHFPNPETAILKQDGQILEISLKGIAGVNWQMKDISNPPHDWESKNLDTRMLFFETTIPESTELAYEVYFQGQAN